MLVTLDFLDVHYGTERNLAAQPFSQLCLRELDSFVAKDVDQCLPVLHTVEACRKPRIAPDPLGPNLFDKNGEEGILLRRQGNKAIGRGKHSEGQKEGMVIRSEEHTSELQSLMRI